MALFGILLSQDAQDKEFATKICNAHGLQLYVTLTLPGVRRMISKDAVFFWNLDSLDAPQIELAQTLLRHLDADRVFGIGSKPLNEYTNVLKMRALGHYFRRGLPSGEVFGTRILGAILSPDPLGIDLLAPVGGPVKKISIKRAKDRSLAAEAVANVMDQKSLPPRLSQMVGQSVDELLMNAIFDAPVVKGNRYRLAQDRKFDFELIGNEVIELQMISTDEAILIGITDFFGSLARGPLLGYLAKDYEASDYSAAGGTGAGLGVYGIVDSGVSLSYVVKTGHATQATLLIPVVEGFKEFRNSCQIFSMIQRA